LSISRTLRHNPTEAESRLWRVLRGHQMDDTHFRRQHTIGSYIVDFCAPSKKLIIEVDGSQHLDREAYDLERTAVLESQGYRVLRFWNHEVLNDLDGVVGCIVEVLEGMHNPNNLPVRDLDPGDRID
jgi:very-short-patch-repair endonuclease